MDNIKNDKAKRYLQDRILSLSEEKNMLAGKIEENDLQIDEAANKIIDLKGKIDEAYELFSPRSGKNDFVRNEIESLENTVVELKNYKDDCIIKINDIAEDISVIEEALKEMEDTEDSEDTETYDSEYENRENENDENDDTEKTGLNKEDTGGKKSDKNNLNSTDTIIDNGELNNNSGFGDLDFYADQIVKVTNNGETPDFNINSTDNLLKNISAVINKCDICVKVIDVDRNRAKLELNMISETLRKIYIDIKSAEQKYED